MPLYGSGRIAIDLTASDIQMQNIKVSGAIVNGSTSISLPSNGDTVEVDRFDDAVYKAAKYFILAKNNNWTQTCEAVLIQGGTDGQVTLYSIDSDYDGNVEAGMFSMINVVKQIDKTTGDIKLLISSNINEPLTITLQKSYLT